jgi:hypothetical protein
MPTGDGHPSTFGEIGPLLVDPPTLQRSKDVFANGTAIFTATNAKHEKFVIVIKQDTVNKPTLSLLSLI